MRKSSSVWSDADYKYLLNLRENKVHINDIAKLLGRTTKAIHSKERYERDLFKSLHRHRKNNIRKVCLKCRKPFMTDSKLTYLCFPCKDGPEF